MSGSPKPNKIMIIRHPEKPPKHPGVLDPLDVRFDGQPGGGKSLIVVGSQRAAALRTFFATHRTAAPNPAVQTPDYIYAASPEGESKRPWETVGNLAAWLKFEQDTPQFNTTYSIDGGEQALVKSVLAHEGTVLICWEHKNIMPNIIQAIHAAQPTVNYASLPETFPDVFHLVWVLDRSGSGYTWTSINQELMPGDIMLEEEDAAQGPPDR